MLSRLLSQPGTIVSKRLASVSAIRPPITIPGHPEVIVPKTIRDRAYPKLGNRDIVGYGSCGIPTYFDHMGAPLPAVRFRENTARSIALQEKEKGPWGQLTIDEKKELYRHSFCRTLSELQAPRGEWRFVLSWTLVATGLVLLYTGFVTNRYWRGLHSEDSLISPFVRDDEYKKWVLGEMVKTKQGPIFGYASKYDYEKDEWRK